MSINYSKVSWFLIAFLVWNIFSPNFIDYGPGWPYRLDIHSSLWSLWLIASIAFILHYLKNYKINPKIQYDKKTKNKIANIFTLFFLTLFIILIIGVIFLIF